MLIEQRKVVRRVLPAAGGIEVSVEGDSGFFVFMNATAALLGCLSAQRVFAGTNGRIRCLDRTSGWAYAPPSSSLLTASMSASRCIALLGWRIDASRDGRGAAHRPGPVQPADRPAPVRIAAHGRDAHEAHLRQARGVIAECVDRGDGGQFHCGRAVSRPPAGPVQRSEPRRPVRRLTSRRGRRVPPGPCERLHPGHQRELAPRGSASVTRHGIGLGSRRQDHGSGLGS